MMCFGYGICSSFKVYKTYESSMNVENCNEFSFPLEDTSIL